MIHDGEGPSEGLAGAMARREREREREESGRVQLPLKGRREKKEVKGCKVQLASRNE